MVGNKKYLSLLISSMMVLNIFSQSLPVNYIQTSEDFIEAIKNKKNPENYIKIFEYADMKVLKNQLATDSQKFTFWLNIYNGYIQVILLKNPEKYDDRSSFFKNKQINIARNIFSFSEIEHGILRHSQHKLFLGYFTIPFVNKLEKNLRVDKRDFRIHFALNCGAKSCPPVEVYRLNSLSKDLNNSMIKYLKQTTKYNAEENTAYITSLFSWFRGDFGGISGIKDILFDQNLIPNKKAKLKTTNYDWTLDLGNFIDL